MTATVASIAAAEGVEERSVAPIAGDIVAAVVPAGRGASSVDANPLMNRYYVANEIDNSVTVI
ncbi:hypothetical protein LQL77_32910, partial [Rhodococcus cerastii]|nr:hypothetical protein [Rhodococcus cerastii]